MFDLKECRRIKRECTKKYEGKNIIIDVSQYPLMYLVITHGDGKSWGYFFKYDKDSNVQFKNYRLSSSDNKRAIYARFFASDSASYRVLLLFTTSSFFFV